MKLIKLSFTMLFLLIAFVIADNNSTNTTIENPLEFEDLEYKVIDTSYFRSESSDGSLSDGRRIFVNEGYEVIIDGYVKNLFEDIELRRAYVYLEVRRMDNLELREYIRDLDPGYDEFFRFKFNIPYGDYRHRDKFQVKLYVEAEEKNSYKTHRHEIKFDLEIDKPSEQIRVLDSYLDKSTYSCDMNARLTLRLKNTGRDDLIGKDSISIVVKNNEINLNEMVLDIDMLSDWYENSNIQTITIPLNLSGLSVNDLTKNLEITTYIGRNKIISRDYVFFKVNECPVTITTTTTSSTTTTTVPIRGPDANIIPSYEYVPPLPPVEKEPNYLLALIILVALMCVLTVSLITYYISTT